MAFVEDYEAFFDVDSGFAIDATVAGGTVQIIFRNEYDDSLGISETSPIAEISDEQVSQYSISYKSSIVIGDQTYYVSDIIPDGTGISTLILES